MPDNYLTTAQAAERLGLAARTLRKLCTDGRFPNAERRGRDWIIPAADMKYLTALPRPRNRPRKTAP